MIFKTDYDLLFKRQIASNENVLKWFKLALLYTLTLRLLHAHLILKWLNALHMATTLCNENGIYLIIKLPSWGFRVL